MIALIQSLEFPANFGNCCSCNTLSPDSTPTQKIDFVDVERFGDTSAMPLGKIADVTVDDSNRVYLAEMDRNTIHVFASDGSYLDAIGREGQGPGEFNAIGHDFSMQIRNHKLYATVQVSIYSERLNVFDLEDLSYSYTVNLLAENYDEFEELEGYYPRPIFYPREDGIFLVKYANDRQLDITAERVYPYYLHDDEGYIISDQIIKTRRLEPLMYEPRPGFQVGYDFRFMPTSLIAVSGDGKIYSTWNEDFKIYAHDPMGEYVHTIEHSFENNPLSHEDLYSWFSHDEQAIEIIEKADNHGELPETWPAIGDMFFDDENRLWVGTYKDLETLEYWILQKSGKVIATFDWPYKDTIEEVKNGYMYVRDTEKIDETEYADIIKYRINFKNE